MRLFPLLAVLLLAACSTSPNESGDFDETLILISIDGFRAGYMEQFDTPNLAALAGDGVYANEGMLSVYPTKTFPNHYSIATGLYPASSGMVANTMYDERSDSWFRISDRSAVEDPFWWGGEPIWVTAELQGKTAATFFWVGSEAPVKDTQATYWLRHDAGVPGIDRVDQVLDWLDLPASERPSVITLYFSDVDTQGHIHGPESSRTERAVGEVDALIGRLVTGLERRGIRDKTNLMVVSDHGMTNASPDKIIILEDHFDFGDGQVVDYSPILAIRPNDGREAAIRDGLSNVEGLKLLSEADLEAFHYTGHHRIPGIIAQVDEGWTLYSSRERLERVGPPNPGNHGYDPRTADMQALFIANGPAFEQGLEVSPFENIHLYNLMARVADLKPAENDGDFNVVRAFLK